MKLNLINEFLSTRQNLQATRSHHQSSLFEQNLKGNTYYKTHQPIWEKSAVTFKQQIHTSESVTNPGQGQLLNKHKTQTKSINQPDPGTNNHVMQPFHELPKEATDHPGNDSKNEYINFLTQSTPTWSKSSNPLNWLNKKLQAMPAHRYSQLKCLLPLSNHQLCIRNNQASLSLQTIDQTEKQTNDLVKTIQTLLKSKGIVLRQCRINGELQ